MPFSCTWYHCAEATDGQLTTTESAASCPTVTSGPVDGPPVGVGVGVVGRVGLGVGVGVGVGCGSGPVPLPVIRKRLFATFQWVAR